MYNRSRRDFLKISALAFGGAVVSTGLAGCLADGERRVAFRHGVASGDPLSDRVIIWTRVTPEETLTEVRVSWEVASDAEFRNLLRSGTTTTTAERDFTVKVDVQALSEGSGYYYRFKSNGKTSAVGRTRTLPAAGVQQVRFAVFSCSNYPAGFFHAYAEAAARDDLDAVIHLGDYIYEYAMGGYATEDAEAMGRAIPEDNDTELFTLTDYRKRYALYRTDGDLQALHAVAPFIAVWDDHEVTNDSWHSGAENHNDGEGDFTERKLQALRAYFEWMPVRPAAANDEETIYRSFRFGDLVDLHMLDTRIIGRDQQLDYADYMIAGPGGQPTLDSAAFTAALTDVNRTLLGMEQRMWLQTQLVGGAATWQVLGQQVLMGRMNVPAELLIELANPSAASLAKFQELATLKGRLLMNDPSLTDEERARVETVIPYNLDAWDGYYVEREAILGAAATAGSNLVVLAGDTHNAWASNLATMGGSAVGVEFATPAVSSPGLEEYLQLPPEAVAGAEQGFTLLVDDLQYVNVNQRGYMLVTFTASEARADWIFVSTVKSGDYQVVAERGHSLRTLPGAGNRTLQAVAAPAAAA